jgi:hypothetical protein
MRDDLCECWNERCKSSVGRLKALAAYISDMAPVHGMSADEGSIFISLPLHLAKSCALLTLLICSVLV